MIRHHSFDRVLALGASWIAVLAAASPTHAAVGGGGVVVVSVAGSSITQTIIPLTVNQTINTYSTQVTGVLLGQGVVFNQTIPFAAGSAPFNTLTSQAATAVTSAGAPLIVHTLAPRLISHAATTQTSSTVADTVLVPAPAHSSISFNAPLTDPRYTIVSIVTPAGPPVTVPTNFLGVCATGVVNGNPPSGCVGGDNTSYTSVAGTVIVATYANYNEDVQRTTTTTTNTLTTESWEVDGVAARLGAVHTVAPVAGFDQADGFLGRTLTAGEATDDRSYRPWAQVWGGWNRTDGRGGIPGDTRDSAGLDAGFDTSLGHGVRIGAGLDTGDTRIALSSVGEHARLNLTQVGAIIGFEDDRHVFANLTGALGSGDVDTSVSPIGAGATSLANYKLRVASLAAEVGVRGQWRDVSLTPSIGISTTRASVSAFAETGSSFGLSSPGGAFVRNRAWIGLTGAMPLTPVSPALTVQASVKAVKISGDLVPTLAAGFGGATAGLTIQGPDQQPWAGDLALGLNLNLGRSARAYVAYEALLSRGAQEQTAQLGVRWHF